MRFAAVLTIVLFGASLFPLPEHSAGAPIRILTTPFDEYGNICWENEQARLDNFAIQLQNQPTATGYIAVYAGRISCPNEAKYRGNRAKSWLLHRGVSPRQIVLKDGGFQDAVRTILVISPQGAGEPRTRPAMFDQVTEGYSFPPSLKKNEVTIRKHCLDKMFAKVLCLKR